MNLRIFLQETDKITKSMSKAELQAFIHENSRTLPERLRGSYLETLKTFSTAKRDEKDVEEKRPGKVDFEQEYEEIMEQLDRISDGELCFGGKLNYDYDDWYNSDEEEFLLSDPDGVADVVEEACGFVRQCVDCEQYQLGYAVAEELLDLEMDADIEEGYEFYDTLGIGDLRRYGLGDVDCKKLLVDGLYCVYLANDIDRRADPLYQMMEKSKSGSVTLEMVLQNGTEITDLDDFLPLWIDYLGKRTGFYVQGLLQEALEMAGDEKMLLDSARRYCDWHPSLYGKYVDGMISSRKDCGEIFQIGDEALANIKDCYVVRSRIAKKLGMSASAQGLWEKAEGYWLEAFRSETDVTNFFGLFCESRDSGRYIGEMKKIYQGMYRDADKNRQFSVSERELQENCPDMANINLLAFLGGEFRFVKEHAMNVSAALGWSQTFMKCGLAAFLLLLFEGEQLRSAGREMCRNLALSVNFDKEEYEKFTGNHTELESTELFWLLFKTWKGKNPMEEVEKQEYLKWVSGLIRKRVDGIMEANRRKYYGECAAYIAAFGEVLESRQEPRAKQRILLEYKKLYSRRSAFHQELRAYGMVDRK